MGEDEETNPTLSKLELPFLPLPAATAHSPEHLSGTATPPLHAEASVPFKWEEEPGKPRPCTDIIALSEPVTKSLELPPCRMLLMEPANQVPKMPSPTTVLDGPDNVGRPKFSSFRLFREAQLGSFDSSSSGSPHYSAVDVLFGKKKRGFFGKSLRFKNGKKEVDEGSLGSSPYSVIGCEVKMEGYKMTRNGSSSSFSRAGSTTHLWATVYEGLKQAMPWKSARKSKKERLRLKEFNL